MRDIFQKTVIMAVALVEIDENEKFTINQEGLAVLEKIPGKVAVFMMTGKKYFEAWCEN